MVSSFFSRSKPINFIAVGVYIAFFCLYAQFIPITPLKTSDILIRIGGLLIYIVSMLLLNYITRRNNLSRKNTHTILLYAFLTVILPYALQRPELMLANFFVLLGIRRLLSLRNPKYITNKIFDAATCIAIASLFYFWSILFLIVVFFGVFYFVSENYKHWLIPFIGVAMVYLFANCFSLLYENSFFTYTEYIAPVSFAFNTYLKADQFFSLGVFSICMLFFFIVYSVKSKQNATKGKPAMKLMMIQVGVGIVIAMITPEKNTSEFIFMAAPLAVVGTSYLKLSHSRWVQEVNIWVFLLLPLITLVF